MCSVAGPQGISGAYRIVLSIEPPGLAICHSFTQQAHSQLSFWLPMVTPALRIQFDSSHGVQVWQECLPSTPPFYPSCHHSGPARTTFHRDCCCDKLLMSVLADFHNLPSTILSPVLPRRFPQLSNLQRLPWPVPFPDIWFDPTYLAGFASKPPLPTS